MQLAVSGLPFVPLKHIILASSFDGLSNSCIQPSGPSPPIIQRTRDELLAHPPLVIVKLSFTILKKEIGRKKGEKGKSAPCTGNLPIFKPKVAHATSLLHLPGVVSLNCSHFPMTSLAFAFSAHQCRPLQQILCFQNNWCTL